MQHRFLHAQSTFKQNTEAHYLKIEPKIIKHERKSYVMHAAVTRFEINQDALQKHNKQQNSE